MKRTTTLAVGLLAAAATFATVTPHAPHGVSASGAARAGARESVSDGRSDVVRGNRVVNEADPEPSEIADDFPTRGQARPLDPVTRGVQRVGLSPSPGNHAEEEGIEVHTGAASNGTSTKQMTHHGGPTQTSPKIYLVFWGNTWTTNGDPYGVANQLHYFYGGIGGSTWANALKQFSGSTGSFTNPTGQYKGWLRDTTAVPAAPTQADMAAAAKRAALRIGDYSYNAQYIIALPWGYYDQRSQTQSFCAWHNYTYVNATQWITYTAMPYIPYLDSLGKGCGGYKVNPTSGRLDGVTILASHEYAESVNDPGLNAWYDADGDENADKCHWVNLANRTFANGYSFPVEPYWSNQWRTQYGYGCYYS